MIVALFKFRDPSSSKMTRSCIFVLVSDDGSSLKRSFVARQGYAAPQNAHVGHISLVSMTRGYMRTGPFNAFAAGIVKINGLQ